MNATATATINAVTTFLLCYGLVLAMAWVRAMAREPRQMHIAHVVTLMGVLVPGIAGVVFLVVLGSILGLPQVVLVVVLAVPAGVVVAFQLEVSRLRTPTVALELRRLGMAGVLTGAVLVLRGGI